MNTDMAEDVGGEVGQGAADEAMEEVAAYIKTGLTSHIYLIILNMSSGMHYQMRQ